MEEGYLWLLPTRTRWKICEKYIAAVLSRVWVGLAEND